MFPEFRKRKTELAENGNFRLFAANRKQTEMANFCFFAKNGNGKQSLFTLVGKR
jgi:hypothetical protein